MTEPVAFPTPLSIGQTVNACVRADERWNQTFVLVHPGEQYRFEVLPRDQVWKDWRIPATAVGYSKPYLRPFERFRRVPGAAWFALVGTIGKTDDGAFVIGAGVTKSMDAAGKLVCFANDISFLYWNNHGSLQLSVSRLA
jgi:hypothetical protein